MSLDTRPSRAEQPARQLQQNSHAIFEGSSVDEARRSARVRSLPVNVATINPMSINREMTKASPKNPASESTGGLSASEAAKIVSAGGKPEKVVLRSPSESVGKSSEKSTAFDADECGSDSPAATLAKFGSITGANSERGIDTSDLLDLIEWINKVVDDRLRDDFQRYGWDSQRRQF
jgi:hypothetical protein